MGSAQATSETGVRGLMQLTEETARHLGVRRSPRSQGKHHRRGALSARV